MNTPELTYGVTLRFRDHGEDGYEPINAIAKAIVNLRVEDDVWLNDVELAGLAAHFKVEVQQRVWR